MLDVRLAPALINKFSSWLKLLLSEYECGVTATPVV